MTLRIQMRGDEFQDVLRREFFNDPKVLATSEGRRVAAEEEYKPKHLRREEADAVSFSGRVTDAGGGMVTILVDRDTEQYPVVGSTVLVTESR